MHENCGVAAVIDLEGKADVVPLAVALAHSLQHRGELGAGIAWKRPDGQPLIDSLKDNGLVRDVLSPDRLRAKGAQGSVAIAHTRYATNESLQPYLVQPFQYAHSDPRRAFAFGFNGNIPDYRAQEAALRENGCPPRFEGDTEIIGQTIVSGLRDSGGRSMRAVLGSLGALDGSINVVLMNGAGNVYAVRDQWGFHPLAYAQNGSLVAVASEDSALRALWHDVRTRTIDPGEMIKIDADKRSVKKSRLWEPTPALCFFEAVYFADHRARIDRVSVANARYECGKILGEMDRETPVGDIVVPVPESAKIAANGYTDLRRMRRVDAISKREEVGRTFITPGDREQKALLKYDIDASLIAGRSVVLIDDSLVRGTTMKVLVRQLREKGAKEIHLRLASPPILSPCFYGIDFSTVGELLAHKYSDGTLVKGVLPDGVLHAIATDLGIDSIKYLPVQAIPRALGKSVNQLCMACVSQNYPTPAGQRLYQLALKK